MPRIAQSHKVHGRGNSSSTSDSHAQKKQGMQLPTAAAFISIFLAMYVIPLWHSLEGAENWSTPTRLEWALTLTLPPTATLLALVMRQAFFRMSSPADIDAALQKPTLRASIQQSQIQNTLEQLVMAVPVYLCASVHLPSSRLMALPMAASLFVIGRFLFVMGYDKSSPGRAFGFILTVIPTLLLLLELAWGWSLL